MKNISFHTTFQAKTISFTALFAALCYLGTICVSVPLPASGYFNIGDVFVLLGAWLLGPWLGAAAAGVGCALADITLGFGMYAPATFLIKAIDAFVAYMVWRLLKKCIKNTHLDFLVRSISALIGECCMVLGYFLFDGILAGSFLAALPNVLGNVSQGVCCAICAVLIAAALTPIKSVRSLFPRLIVNDTNPKKQEPIEK